ncbi:MAG: response regulator [Deltaproteobacteria bacterium]|nr:response regulator [Deltaproteobacteria bacterium]MBW2341499.1 response regulator [Deltaproteobacteria bacterium]
MKILVVDDEFVSRKKMKKIMETFGKCEAVNSGSGAMIAFRRAWENRDPFDVIALDISMPEMDGKEVLLKIRQIEREGKFPGEKQVKILMVTSHSDKDTIITCIQTGCDDYIVKPFDREIVAKKLEKLGFKSREQRTRSSFFII